MKPKTLLIYLISIFLLLPLNLKAKTHPITWDPKIVKQTIELGDTTNITVQFISNKNLGNAEAWIVPELQPFLSLDQTSFNIVKGNTYTVNLTINIASGTQSGFYDGAIHLKLGSETIPAIESLTALLHLNTIFNKSFLAV